MNTFILDRHTDPQNPTVTSVQNDRIPVYNTVADAEADLANLEVGQIIATKEVEKSLFDYIYPIGSTYTQYPDCASPNELWPDTTWTELDFNGAFFRATGGLAQAFDNQTSMQGQGTIANGLSVDSCELKGCATQNTGKNNGPFTARCGIISSLREQVGYSVGGDGSWSGTYYKGFNIDATHSHSLSSTDQETRPMNYTIKIWKRTA